MLQKARLARQRKPSRFSRGARIVTDRVTVWKTCVEVDGTVDQNAPDEVAHLVHGVHLLPLVRDWIVDLGGFQDGLAHAEPAGNVHLALIGDDGAAKASLVHRAHVLPLVRRGEVSSRVRMNQLDGSFFNNDAQSLNLQVTCFVIKSSFSSPLHAFERRSPEPGVGGVHPADSVEVPVEDAEAALPSFRPQVSDK